MRALLIDGHPDADRLTAHLLDEYQQALPEGLEVTRLVYFDPTGWRYKRQVLGFVGFKPIRLGYFGMVRRGGAEENLEKWRARIRKMATSAGRLRRGRKS